MTSETKTCEQHSCPKCIESKRNEALGWRNVHLGADTPEWMEILGTVLLIAGVALVVVGAVGLMALILMGVI